MRALHMALYMKRYYVSGVIKDFRKRKDEVSKIFGVGGAQLMRWLKVVMKYDLCYWVGKHLHFRRLSIMVRKLCVAMSFKVSGRHYSVNIKNFNLDVFEALCVADAVAQRSYMVLRNRKRYLQRQIDLNNLQEGMDLSVGRNADRIGEMLRCDLIQRGYSVTAADNIAMDGLSRGSVARACGRKSKASGHRIIKRLRELDLVKDTTRRYTYNYVGSAPVSKSGVDRAFSYNGWMQLTLSNKIQVCIGS